MIGFARPRASTLCAALAMAAAFDAAQVIPAAAPAPKPKGPGQHGSSKRVWGAPPVSNTSMRMLRKAVNRGFVPPQPTEKAMGRHAWRRKQLFFAALRKQLGQA